MRKIVFLDIDGVLNTERHQNHCKMEGIPPVDEFGYAFDAEAVDNLAAILTATGAEIVVSSSWKFYGMEALRGIWNERGLPGVILDITPNGVSDEMLLNADPESIERITGKGYEIKEWLSKYGEHVSHYAIIDDEDVILPEQHPYFVQTNPWKGITKEITAKIIKILNKQAP